MSQQLRAFYAAIMADADKLGAFFRDPEGMLAGFDLTEEEKELVLNGDREALEEYLAANPASTPAADPAP